MADTETEVARAWGRLDARRDADRGDESPEAYMNRMARLVATDGDPGDGTAGLDADALETAGEMVKSARGEYLAARRSRALVLARKVLAG